MLVYKDKDIHYSVSFDDNFLTVYWHNRKDSKCGISRYIKKSPFLLNFKYFVIDLRLKDDDGMFNIACFIWCTNIFIFVFITILFI